MKILNLSTSWLALLCPWVFLWTPSAVAQERPHAGLSVWQEAPGLVTGLFPETQGLTEFGLELNLIYTAEVIATLHGGMQQRDADYLHNFDLMLTANLAKILGWPGAKVFIYGLGNNGGDPNETDIGSFQGVSNIEAPDTWKLYEAWIEQNVFDERLSFLFGLHDLNSEFDVIETAALFLNPSHGIGADFSQTGQNGPSIFPTTSLAARVRFQPLPYLYFQSAVYDGVPGDPQNSKGTQVKWDDDEGFLVVTEFGVRLGENEEERPAWAKYAVGSWVYTAEFEDLIHLDTMGNPEQHGGNFGFYGLADLSIFREKASPEQGLRTFTRLGWAQPDFNEADFYAGIGLVYRGLLPHRDEDDLGAALALVGAGGPAQQSAFQQGEVLQDNEINVEVSYRAQVLPWLAIQPDFQWFGNPGFSAREDVWVFGTRWEVLIW